jgi:Rps23 Pro-64 3,4-dihydroxylase Tpa1-like proline 4-hydroxylase
MLIGGKKFELLRQLFLERIEPTLSKAFDWFRITPPKEENYTVQMTTHAEGDFYRIHKDTGPQHPRVLSYIYYFHKQPKAFSGGELQLFDMDTKNDCASTTFTAIEPVHNSLIVFPSEYYHQVCTVNLASEDRLLGRHTINGWLVKATRETSQP